MEYRATMVVLSPSTVNVRLSAVRKMVFEARKNGMIGAEEAANLTEVPNIPQKGTRLGNWLTREQAKELLAVPDRSQCRIPLCSLASRDRSVPSFPRPLPRLSLFRRLSNLVVLGIAAWMIR
jgi:hypothetical protein